MLEKELSSREPFRQQNSDSGHSGFSPLEVRARVRGSKPMKKIFALFALA
jgi:hypothetical protein